MSMLFDPALQWRAAHFLWLLLWPVLWLALAWWRRHRGGMVVEARLLPWMQVGLVRGGWGHHLQTLLQLAGWCLLVVALAGPRMADYRYSSKSLAVRDVMIVLDLSRSMSASDVEPNRLQRAILEIRSLLQHSQYTRYGLVVYAGRAHLLAPLSHDPAPLLSYLKALDTGLLPSAGSDLVAGMHLALDELDAGHDVARAQAVWLLSDGGLDRPMEQQQGRWDALLARIHASGIKVFATGVGTVAGAPLLGRQGWLSVNGEQVISRLNARWLRQLAAAGGGRYVTAVAGDRDRRSIYDHGIAQMGMPIEDQGEGGDIHWRNLQQSWLLVGFLLWWLSLLGPGRWSGLQRPAHGLALLFLLALMAGSHNLQAAASALAQRAGAYYQAGDYVRAEQAYARVVGYRGRFGQAAAAYHQGHYSLAVSQFTLAFLKAGDDMQRATALFNLANSYFKLGDYRQAAAIYADVLRYDPGFEAATNNRQLALSLQAEVDKFVQKPLKGQAGKGVKEMTPPPGTAVNDARIHLAEEQKRYTTYVPLSREQFYQLILKGVSFNTSHATRAMPLSTTDYRALIEQQVDLKQMQQRIVSFHDGYVFWRSLFEYEEGYPAPLQRPEPLPGQTPW